MSSRRKAPGQSGTLLPSSQYISLLLLANGFLILTAPDIQDSPLQVTGCVYNSTLHNRRVFTCTSHTKHSLLARHHPPHNRNGPKEFFNCAGKSSGNHWISDHGAMVADVGSQPSFYCPTTGEEIETPLGLCSNCHAAHDIIWQSVFVCPNTGYRIESPSRRPDKECPSCFQLHHLHSKRVYICPVTGAQIQHPRDTGGRCTKCGRSHEDNSTPMGSKEAVMGRSFRD